jgi:hypothetical protein
MKTDLTVNEPFFDRKQYFSEREICQCFAIEPPHFRTSVKNARVTLFYLEDDSLGTIYYIRKADLKQFVSEMLKT